MQVKESTIVVVNKMNDGYSFMEFLNSHVVTHSLVHKSNLAFLYTFSTPAARLLPTECKKHDAESRDKFLMRRNAESYILFGMEVVHVYSF